MSTVHSKRIQAGYEPIKGYRLEKRIGRGGYGEVWRATAPGGLKKAVKFVYGQQDERRAEQELKSLERIKGVQHPFILTLERFELIERQLVIVTELADGSLEDIFNDHRERGSCGIPRDKLLQHMRDAADALDYLHQLYRLQHLDIKPANLLIVGGRVKVADFGLLKDLGDVECSVVGGLTPIYAPPEVFDGKPSMHSDQYSLAVMYQELLTSTRPFSGRTIAQLATQHVHNAPNLKPLPPGDRPCVARALEKSPDRRFSSCSEFVEKLFQPTASLSASSAKAEEPSESAPKHAVSNLPEISDSEELTDIQKQCHTLVVALGGTGADCLNQIRSRIYSLGAASPMTLHSVLIDTDPVTTQTAVLIDPTENVPRCRVVDARLRTAGEYRDSGTERFQSISRRWIYNVPRNHQTGGMRPLGRLALIDHAKEVNAAIQDSIEDLREGVNSGGTVRVYVVGSLTGGTGSGMYLDVVHLLRHFLDENAFENVNILSLLTTNRFQGDPSRPLALHATRSSMKELAFFLKPGNGYPGDEGAGWPSVPAARTPLRDAYVVAQGVAPGAPKALDSVVNYLWHDATVCGESFEKGRLQTAEDSDQHPVSVRTLGAVEIGNSSEHQATLLSPTLAKTLLLQWLGDSQDQTEALNGFINRVTTRNDLNADALLEHAESVLAELRGSLRNSLMEHLKTLDPSILKDIPRLRSKLTKFITESIDLDQAQIVTDQVARQIERELKTRLSDEKLNYRSAIKALVRSQQEASEIRKSLLERSDRQFQEIQEEHVAPSSLIRPLALLRRSCDIGLSLVDVVASRVAAAIATDLVSRFGEVADRYRVVVDRIQHCVQLVNQDCSCGEQGTLHGVSETMRNQFGRVVRELHRMYAAGQRMKWWGLEEEFHPDVLVTNLTESAASLIRQFTNDNNTSATAHGGTTASLDRLRDVAGSLSDSTNPVKHEPTEARTTSLTQTTEHSSVTQTHNWISDEDTPALTLDAAVEAVRPPLLECGGWQRLFLLCGTAVEKESLLAEWPKEETQPVNALVGRGAIPTLIHEAEGIELSRVLDWLDSLTGDDGKISARLASRCDVEW
ncbi:MAG: tubulin-like doman-containing protein [Planctomycetota bacterium]